MAQWKPLALGALVCLAIGAPNASFAQVTKKGDAYLFRRKFKTGALFRYAMNTSIQTDKKAPPNKATSEMTWTVKSATPSEATLEIKVAPMELNGKTSAMATVIEAKMNAQGRILQGKLSEEMLYPEKPLKAGEKMRLKGGEFLEGDCIFKGVRAYKGRPAALLAMDVNMKQSAANWAKGTVAIYIALEDGWPLATEIHIQGMGQTQNGSAPILLSASQIRR